MLWGRLHLLTKLKKEKGQGVAQDMKSLGCYMKIASVGSVWGGTCQKSASLGSRVGNQRCEWKATCRCQPSQTPKYSCWKLSFLVKRFAVTGYLPYMSVSWDGARKAGLKCV